MKIVDVIWDSDEVSNAEIILSDGNFSLTCFASSFYLTKGAEIEVPIFAFDTQNIAVNFIKNYSVEKRSEPYSYGLIGKVINKDESILKIGEILIELDMSLPCDTKNGDFVSFNCSRLDLISSL